MERSTTYVRRQPLRIRSLSISPWVWPMVRISPGCHSTGRWHAPFPSMSSQYSLVWNYLQNGRQFMLWPSRAKRIPVILLNLPTNTKDVINCPQVTRCWIITYYSLAMQAPQAYRNFILEWYIVLKTSTKFINLFGMQVMQPTRFF